MTDLRPDLPDDPLPRQLAGWFDREVRQAAADLQAAPLGSRRTVTRSRSAALGPLVAVAVVVIVVAAGLTRLPRLGPGVVPTGSGTAAASAGGTPPASIPNPTWTAIPALSVDSRYPDGIPSSLGGQPVGRVTDLDGAPIDDGSFLLGGWMLDWANIAFPCPIILGTPPPFGPVCGKPYLLENPLTDELARVMLDGWNADIHEGPVVLQVHRHDARAVLCEPDRREACEETAVIEGVAWAGDAMTATAPLGATDTFMRLIEADASLPQATLTPLPDPGPTLPLAPGQSASPLLPARTCVAPYPDQAWRIEGSAIELVLVFQTVAAREAVKQNFNGSGFIGSTEGGGTCQVITDSYFGRRWIAVENVMVAVQVNVDGPTAAQSKVIDEVRQALQRP